LKKNTFKWFFFIQPTKHTAPSNSMRYILLYHRHVVLRPSEQFNNNKYKPVILLRFN